MPPLHSVKYNITFFREINLTTVGICIDTVVDDELFEDENPDTWKIILMSKTMLEILEEPTVSFVLKHVIFLRGLDH